MAEQSGKAASRLGFQGLIVRPVAEGDAEALSRFYLDLSPRSDYFFRPYRDKSPAAMAHIIRQSFTGHEDGYVVLDKSGGVIGHIFFGAVTQEVPHLGIGLADEHQNSGLGTMLLQFLIAVGRRKLGKRAIGLSVMKTNTRAIQVYQRCGFRIRGQCSFRSEDDSYVMELEYGAAGREDLGRVGEFYRRSLGIPLDLDTQVGTGTGPGGTVPAGSGVSRPPDASAPPSVAVPAGVPTLPGAPDAVPGGTEAVTLRETESEPGAGGGPGWRLDLAVLLRRGECAAAARSEILEPVREILSEVEIPEAAFGEEIRARLAGAVAAGGTEEGEVFARWSACFFCPRGALRLYPDPGVRRVTPEEASALRERIAPGESPGSAPGARYEPVWAAERDGDVEFSLQRDLTMIGGARVAEVTAAASGEFRDEARFERVLAPLVAELQSAGSLVVAEPAFDDVPLLRGLEAAGMESYGHVFRVWRRMG